MTTFQEGDWLQWVTPNHVKEGQVIITAGPSLVVRWLSGDEQVFPTYEGYVPPYGGLAARMVRIERPKEALRVQRDINHGRMSVLRAASTLGTTPKRVRAMLRAGQLKGEQQDGKWVSVDLET